MINFITRFGLFSIFVFLFLNINETMAQDSMNAKVSLKVDNLKLKEVLKSIENQTGFNFSYTSIVGDLPVHFLKIQNKPLYETLIELAKYLKVGFKKEDKIIAVLNKQDDDLNLFFSKSNNIKGALKGIIYNASDKKPVVGSSILIGKLLYITNDDGAFNLLINPGTYNLRIHNVGYKDTTIEGITVKENQSINFNIYLKQFIYALNEVKVEASRRTTTEKSLLIARKNAATITDAISAENIENTSSITVIQALQKLPGSTVRDDKFVAIDGLSDRSIIATLNGARLSSSNTDHNATPFDIIPAGFLDAIKIDKTLIPDHPSDAVAGIIDLKTKSVPDSLEVKFSIQLGLNDNIGFGGNYYSFKNASPGIFGQNIKNQDLSKDFLGLQNEFKSNRGNGFIGNTNGFVQDITDFISNSRQNPQNYPEAVRISNVMKSFDPTLTGTATEAPLNKLVNISIGDNLMVFNRKLGLNLSGVYYQNSTSHTGINNVMTLSEETSTPNNLRLINPNPLNEITGINSIIFGLSGTATYRLNSSNEVSLIFLTNSSADVETTGLSGSGSRSVATGEVGDRSFVGKSNYQYYLHSTKRDFNTFQFRGAHRIDLTNNAPVINWSLSKSISTQDEPDYRQVSLVIDSTQSDPNYLVNYTYNINSGRFYRTLNENETNASIDISIPILNKKTSLYFKTGINYLYRDRQFSEIFLSLPYANQLHLPDVQGDLNKLLAPARMGIDENALNNSTDGSNIPVGNIYDLSGIQRYAGYSKNGAFYGQLDLKLFSKTRIIGGLRFENTDIHAIIDSTFSNLGKISKAQYDSLFNINYKVKYLPHWSFSLIHELNKKMNLRFSYAQTFSRPEIRELLGVNKTNLDINTGKISLILLSGIKLYDPTEQQYTIGNANLKNSSIQSYNVRWDFFPQPEELFSIGLFYKNIDNPLEKVFNGLNYIQFQNNSNAGLVYGFEFEIRQSLSKITHLLNHFYASANFMYSYSKISYSAVELQSLWEFNPYASKFHPLFDQPPYAVNCQINYDNNKNGLDLNLNYNITGERLIQINENGTPGIYEQPSPNLDFSFAKRIFKNIFLKGFCKNILDSYYSSVYTISGNGGKFGTGNLTYYRQRYQLGRYFSIGFNYKFH